MVTGIVLEELEVETVVFGLEVVLLAVVTALGDVVGNAGRTRGGRGGGVVAIYPQKFSGVDQEPRSLTPTTPTTDPGDPRTEE